MDVPSLSGINLSGFGPANANGPAARPAPTPDSQRAAVSQQGAVARPVEAKDTPPPTLPQTPERPAATGTRLRFDEGTNRVVAQIVDETNSVIKQIPPEELLRIAAKFKRLTGLIFDREV